MENLKILKQGNFDSPTIALKTNSCLFISGNSISTKPECSYNPLIKWIDNYKGDNLKIDIDLNIMNCSSVRMLLKAIVAADTNNQIKKKYINWFYADKEQEELGEIMSSMITSSKFILMNKQ